MRLADPRFSASTMISVSMTQVLIRRRHRLDDEGVRAAHRLLVTGRRSRRRRTRTIVGRCRRDAEHLADLLGQLRIGPSGEEHQASCGSRRRCCSWARLLPFVGGARRVVVGRGLFGCSISRAGAAAHRLGSPVGLPHRRLRRPAGSDAPSSARAASLRPPPPRAVPARLRGHPALDVALRRAGHPQRTRRHVLRDHRCRPRCTPRRPPRPAPRTWCPHRYERATRRSTVRCLCTPS